MLDRTSCFVSLCAAATLLPRGMRSGGRLLPFIWPLSVNTPSEREESAKRDEADRLDVPEARHARVRLPGVLLHLLGPMGQRVLWRPFALAIALALAR
jgi:hypothetical protein